MVESEAKSGIKKDIDNEIDSQIVLEKVASQSIFYLFFQRFSHTSI